MDISDFISQSSLAEDSVMYPNQSFKKYFNDLFSRLDIRDLEVKLLGAILNFSVQQLSNRSASNPNTACYAHISEDPWPLFPMSLLKVVNRTYAYFVPQKDIDEDCFTTTKQLLLEAREDELRSPWMLRSLNSTNRDTVLSKVYSLIHLINPGEDRNISEFVTQICKNVHRYTDIVIVDKNSDVLSEVILSMGYDRLITKKLITCSVVVYRKEPLPDPGCFPTVKGSHE